MLLAILTVSLLAIVADRTTELNLNVEEEREEVDETLQEFREELRKIFDDYFSGYRK